MANIKLETILVVVWVVALNWIATPADASRILMALPSHSRSHVIVARALLEGLVERGHQVTFISSVPDTKDGPNFRHFFLDWPENLRALYGNATEKRKNRFKVRDVFKLLPNIMDYANGTLAIPQLVSAMESESFDLVIVPAFGGRFLNGLAAHFECPLVYFLPIRPIFAVSSIMGMPSQRSAVPQLLMSGHQAPMTFLDRVKNLLLYTLEELFFAVLDKFEGKYYASVFKGPRYPSYDKISRNASLFLTGHHFSQGPIMANLPSIIEIGGIQMDVKLEPLPEQLQQFLDSATDGFVYFSLGTNVKLATIDQQKLTIILRVLGRLPLPVVLKVDDENMSVDNLPGNILASPWLPQREILAHTHARLFISHGGMNSVTEAKYYGVPLLGIPMFGDQLGNVQKAARDGCALHVDFREITEERLFGEIDAMLRDRRFADTVKGKSRIYRDRPMSPMDWAAYWIEYVIRHGGADHLKSAGREMNMMQRHSVDVLLFMALVVWLSYRTVKSICAVICRSCRKMLRRRKQARVDEGERYEEEVEMKKEEERKRK